jgi:hypothetical protein
MLSTPGHRSGDHLSGTYVPVEEPSTASNPDMASRGDLRLADGCSEFRKCHNNHTHRYHFRGGQSIKSGLKDQSGLSRT